MSLIESNSFDSTAALARSITWQSSKQTYATARLLVDRDLINDFFRAYAYFRWVDDYVDESPRSSGDSITFIQRQKELINQLYTNNRPNDLVPNEELIADLISHDRGTDSGLQSFIRNMLAIIEFDANRRWRTVSENELKWYTASVGKSVTDGLQYFIGNSNSYPDSDYRYSAARAAHITHLLRDLMDDLENGFFNIPQEQIEVYNIDINTSDTGQLQSWVQSQVNLARRYFQDGKSYLNNLNALRCKLAGFWYCLRFERILDQIERDNYQLRYNYRVNRKPFEWLKMGWLGITIPTNHLLVAGPFRNQKSNVISSGRGI